MDTNTLRDTKKLSIKSTKVSVDKDFYDIHELPTFYIINPHSFINLKWLHTIHVHVYLICTWYHTVHYIVLHVV